MSDKKELLEEVALVLAILTFAGKAAKKIRKIFKKLAKRPKPKHLRK